jgi:FkbM family methyltransferase
LHRDTAADRRKVQIIGGHGVLAKLKSFIRPLIRPPLHRPTVEVSHTVYGTEYGGWPLIDGSVSDQSTILSFGLGEDISFDLEAIRTFGCTLHGYDPTPKAIEWIGRQSLPPQFKFHPYGLAAEDGEAEFFAPANASHVSFSATPGKAQTLIPLKAPVYTVGSILGQLNLRAVEVIKMDIEGFEYGVIGNMISSGVRPGQLLVEFHHGMYQYGPADTRAAVEMLREHGYELFYVSSSGHEYGFCQR